MLSLSWRSLGLLVMALSVGLTLAAPGTADEAATARRWTEAMLERAEPARPPEPGLVVVANYKAMQKNGRDGLPLKIGQKQYTRGLFCHALSRVVVRLPGPAASFTAEVGIDNNGTWAGGSVVFSVMVGGKEVFRSPVMLRGQPAAPVSVELGGAREFVLVVGDAGDGINSDQASWGDAKVTLTDGTVTWVGDLPVVAPSALAFGAGPPFSFNYDGKPSAGFLETWAATRSSRRLNDSRTERTLIYADPRTGLEVRCQAVEYNDFPTVEWTLYFENKGANDTPILSDILPLDARFERGAQGEFTLHHHKGTFVRADDFQPLTTMLEPGQKLRFAPPGGRPLGQVFPYYNLEWSGQGVIAVVGWPGQWSAQFTRDEYLGLRLAAGQELTHLTLHPGEQIRTPLIVLQFWKGEPVDAQNTWRRWMLAHNLPRRAGKLPEPMLPAVSGNQFPGLLCNEADEIRYIDRYLEEGIQISHWWMDAGWYINKGDWGSTGTWVVDTNRFPRGLRYISDYAHSKGIKLIVWFEPERVTAGSWLADKHPEWVLGGKNGGLLNLGDPAAWNWLVDRFDRFLTEQGIDLYRQDFNMDPLSYWRGNDQPDRQGITEIKHVQGYLAFWDQLLRRHPDLVIDSCASGGHRNDLETLRRSVPLLRSDYILDSVGEQGHTYGLASWMPFYGTGFIEFNSYIVRSLMGPDMTLSCDARRKDLDWGLLRKLVGQWREVVPNFYGDFYPLSAYSLASTDWMAWQFDRPGAGTGIVQAFRRSDSIFRTAELRLRGLDPQAHYDVANLDLASPLQMSGRELMEKGLAVEIGGRPGAAVVTYRKIR